MTIQLKIDLSSSPSIKMAKTVTCGIAVMSRSGMQVSINVNYLQDGQRRPVSQRLQSRQCGFITQKGARCGGACLGSQHSGGTKGPEVQGHSQLHAKFESSLWYRRLPRNKHTPNICIYNIPMCYVYVYVCMYPKVRWVINIISRSEDHKASTPLISSL